MKKTTISNSKQSINNIMLGKNVKINDFVNLYDCEIGDNCMIGTFVEIQKDVYIGQNCRIQSHTFICSHVHIEDNVFIGHGVIFINDKNPSVENAVSNTWRREKIHVEKNASIGSGAIIIGSISIGENALIGAGSVVTKDIKENEIVAGVPAKVIGLKKP